MTNKTVFREVSDNELQYLKNVSNMKIKGQSIAILVLLPSCLCSLVDLVPHTKVSEF